MAIRKSTIRRLRRELISHTAREWKQLSSAIRFALDSMTEKLAAGKELSDRDRDKVVNDLASILVSALRGGYELNEKFITSISGKRAPKVFGDYKVKVNREWHRVIPEEAIKWIEGYVPEIAGNFESAITERIKEVTERALREGMGIKTQMDALRVSLPEIQAFSKARIEAIARTEITRADTMGRLISMKGNRNVLGVEFSAIMDDRTSDICSERNGLVMRLDDPELASNTPPLHPNCRSMLLPATVYEYPDGLLTSHEFEEVEHSEQREYDVKVIKDILGNRSKEVVESVASVNEDEVSEKYSGYVIKDSGASSMEVLREMSGIGMVPAKVEGTREDRRKIYEAIDEMYDRPEYVTHGKIKVSITDYGNMINIDLHNRQAEGIGRNVSLPSGSRASAKEREGVIKYMLYDMIGEIGLRVHDMYREFPTPELADKYAGVSVKDKETRDAIMKVADDIMLDLTGMHLSYDARKMIEQEWGADGRRWHDSGELSR